MNINAKCTNSGLMKKYGGVCRFMISAVFFATSILPAMAFKEGVSGGLVNKVDLTNKVDLVAVPKKWIVCPGCNGKRYISRGRCDACNGAGKYKTPITRGIGGRPVGGRVALCGKCKGKGEVMDRCERCYGHGKIKQ